MKQFFFLIALTILCIALLIALNACSGRKSPVESIINESYSPALPDSSANSLSNRDILAVYDAVIDPIAKTLTVTPVERNIQYHFPLTQLYPNVLQITGYGWTPNFWADIKLKHPFPGSGIDAFDPRVIAILPANAGVRFIYPVMGVGGNDAVVLEPDGYTQLFDNLGGSIPGNVNPFKAYFKDRPYRVWSSIGVTDETQRWQMNLAGFGGPMQFKLVIDVSTNYPDPSQPIIDNAPEPVEIDAFVDQGLTNQGGSAPVEVMLKHWRDITEVGDVLIESPDLFNNTRQIQFYSYSPYYGVSIFKGTLSNEKIAREGMYKLMIKSWDTSTGIQMFNEFNADVRYLTDGGNLVWATRAGGGGSEKGKGITALSDDSTVITGYFHNIAVFGPGEKNETVLTSSIGVDDIFIARYYSNGSLAWAKRAGGLEVEQSNGITALSDNSTVITGHFYGVATFGQDEPNETVLTSTGETDIFITRYNPDGTLSWAKRAGGRGNDSGFGITSLPDNSTIVTGFFKESAEFGQGEPNETVLTSARETDIFIARYNPDGTLTWAKRAGGTGPDYSYGITSLSDNSTIVTGIFKESAKFGQGESHETILTSAGNFDIFLARYNPDGTLLWAKCAGGSDEDDGYGIATLSDNSTVVTGVFSGTTTFGQGEPNETILITDAGYDIFVARYNPSGTLKWVKRAGGYDADRGFGIISLSDNSIVVTGEFSISATFGQGELNETILTAEEGIDIFIARYNPDGTLKWAKRAGGLLDFDCGFGITTLSDDSTVGTGNFGGTAPFGPGEINETTLTSAGINDIFVARFKP
jgi:uncharacterized delta-60 repeat protein